MSAELSAIVEQHRAQFVAALHEAVDRAFAPPPQNLATTQLRQACSDLLEIVEAVHAGAQPGSIVQHECAQAITAARDALAKSPP